MTGMATRIGYPNEHLAGTNDDIESPMYATSVGLVIRGLNSAEARRNREINSKNGRKIKEKKKRGGIFDALFAKGKGFFLDDIEE
jgi:cell division protein FtsA